MRSMVAVAANAGQVLAIQLLALVTLSPTDFGSFSIQYLVYAFGSSLSFSLVSEAWIRSELRQGVRSTWEAYSSASVYLALAAGFVAFVVSLVFPPLQAFAVVGALAVAAATYRGAARYFSLRVEETRGVLPGDVAGLLGIITTWFVLSGSGLNALWMVVLAWAVGSVASAVASKRPTLGPPRTLASWWRDHAQSIRPLLRDSLLMDAGAIGTPYLLAPVLGLTQFGVYRAISNVAAPVRLILNPIRPQIAAAPLVSQRSPRRAGLVFLISVLMGAAAYACLLIIGAIDIDLGSLSAIVVYALPAAVFVTASFVGHYFYIVARAHLASGYLLAGRVVQTVLAVGVPIGGALTWGLPGAIWGYSVCTAVSAIVWFGLVLSGRESPKAAGKRN